MKFKRLNQRSTAGSVEKSIQCFVQQLLLAPEPVVA
jgi:hypothetical protein